MPVLYANNAASRLAASITNVATSFSVTAGQGARFPAISGGDYFYATLMDSAGNLEIVRVTARATDTFTVTRAQEGTTARAYAVNDIVELRITRAMLDDFKTDTRAGNAATATALQTARTIGGVSFNGTANINLPGVNTAGNQNTTGNAATVTNGVYTTGNQTIAGVKTFSSPIVSTGTFAINGSAGSDQPTGLYVADLGSTVGTTLNPTFTAAIMGQWSTARSVGFSSDGTYIYGFRSHTTASTYTWSSRVKLADALTTARTIGGVIFDGSANINLPGVNAAGNQNTTGSAATLTTARTINGTSFNGSANILTANWGTARTLTIGATGKSVDGSANVSWSLAEIGAAAAVHDHAGLLHRNSSVADANTALTEGTYGFGAASGLLNYPWASGYGKLVVTVNDGGTHNNTNNWIWQVINDTSGQRYSRYKVNAGAWTAWVLESTGSTWNGNATTATTIQTARTINGVSFNGSANITVADATKLPLAGGTLTGGLTGPKATMTGTGNDFNTGGFETVGNGATNTVFPTIGFHQPSLYASSLQLRAAGDFRFFAQGGTTLANVTAATFTGALSGNATTATTLQTARTIGGVSFNGSANINLPGVNTAGNQNTTGNAATVTNGVYTTGDQTIGGSKTFSSPIRPPATAQSWIGGHRGGSAVSIATTGSTGSFHGWVSQRTPSGGFALGTLNNDVYLTWATNANIDANTNTVFNALIISSAGTVTAPTFSGALSGNATTATTLQTARTINGTSFNGSANITTANWGTARTITIGSTGKSVDGSANVAWTLAEIGALPLSGGAINTSGSASSLIITDTGANGANLRLNGNGATTPNKTIRAFNGSLEIINSGYTASCMSVTDAGNLTAAGNVTANSDERLKKDWAALPADFIERLATTKSGTYTRTDSGDRQAGASAQDWQALLPEVVSVGSDDQKTLSLAYGNAALVSAIELAKRLLELEKDFAVLKEAVRGPG